MHLFGTNQTAVFTFVKLLPLFLVVSLTGCNYFESDADRLAKAKELYTQNDFKTAEVVIKKYLQSKPDDGEAWLLLGKIYFSRFKLVDAIESFRRTKESGYRHEDVFLDWLQILVYQGNFAGIEQLLAEQAFADYHDTPRAHHLLGDYAFLKKDAAEAKAHYDKEFARIGSEAIQCLAQVKLLVLEDKQQDVIANSTACETRHADDPAYDRYVSQYLRALAQYNSKEREAASATLQTLLDTYRDSKDPYIKIQSSLLLMRLYQAANKLPEAEKLADALMQYIVLPDLYHVKGLAARHARDLNKAEAQQMTALKIDPQFKPALMEMANIMFLRGNPEQARYYAGKLDSAAGTSSYAKRIDESLAMNLFRQGDMDRVIESLSAVSATGSARTQYILALAHAKKKQSADTWRVYADMQKDLPDTKTRELIKAKLHTELGEYGNAEAIYQKYLADKDVQVLIELAQLYQQQNNYVQAETILKQGLADPAHADKISLLLARHYANTQEADKLFDVLNRMLEKSDNTVSRMLLAKSYYRFGRHADAIKQAEHVLKAEPDNIEALLVQGMAQYRRQEYTQAEKVLNKILVHEPKATNIYMLLSRIAREKSDMPAALGYLDTVLAGEPDYLPAIYARVDLLIAGERNPEALDFAQKAAAGIEDPAIRNILLGDTHNKLGDRNKAYESYQRAAETAQDNVTLALKLYDLANALHGTEQAERGLSDWLDRSGKAEHTLAVANYLLRQGRHAQARQYYEAYLKQDEHNAAVHNNLAWLLAEKGDIQQALVAARRAHALSPASPAIMDTLGWLLLNNGSVAEAEKYLLGAYKSLGHNPSVQYHVAVLYQRQGKHAAAIKLLQGIAAQDFPEAAQASTLLAQLNRAQR